MIGGVLTALIVLALVAIGVGGMVAPGSAATQYGIVLDDPRALGLIRAMAVRDLVIGVLLGVVAYAGTRQALGWAVAFTALIAAVDGIVVGASRSARPRRRLDRAVALHASGALGLLVTAAALLAGC